MSTDPEHWRVRAPTLVVGAVLLVIVTAFTTWTVTRPPPPEPVERGWAPIYDQVAASVLLVSLDMPEPRVGAAFAISATEAVTARHLVIGAKTVRLTDPTGKSLEAQVIGTDARTDVALLRVADGLQPVALGSSEVLRVGDVVLTIGNPFGLGHSLTTGVVAHRGRRLSAASSGPRVDFLQLSIPLNPGNSGGPVFDADGEVVGVLAGTHSQGQAIAFAVPIEAVLAGLAELRDGAQISRAFLGLKAEQEGEALVVSSVVASGPADRAGILPGDVLTAVAGEAVHTPDALGALMDRLPGGVPIAVRLLRDGQLQVADVVLGDWAEQPMAVAGMTLRAEPGAGGVVVAVRPRSRSERAGIQVGDVVRRVDGLPVQAPVDVQAALGRSERATLEIDRDGMTMTANLE